MRSLKSKTCKEGIIAAEQIFPSPSFFIKCLYAYVSLLSIRFSYRTAVSYAYTYPSAKALYILTLYSIDKQRGYGSKTIGLMKEYAQKNQLDLIVTISKKAQTLSDLHGFYEINGFHCCGEDQRQFYYIQEWQSINTRNNSCTITPINNNQKEIYSIGDRTIVTLCLLAYCIRSRKNHPIIIEVINDWFKQNIPEHNNGNKQFNSI
jgi:hypothetical protein